MSKCETCARIITCPRPETRVSRLAMINAELVILKAFIAARLDEGEEVPSGLYVEYILCGVPSPHQLSRRISAVFYRTVMTPPAYFQFIKLFKTSIKELPEPFLMLVHTTLVMALQLYEWEFYHPHVKHFSAIAVGSGLSELSSGVDKMDEILEEQYPCSYLNLKESVEALKAQAPKTVDEAKNIINGILGTAKQEAGKSASAKMPHSVFASIPVVGGIN